MSKLHDTSGEQKEQLLILTDEKGNKVGTATRHECHTGAGKPHLAFMAFVVDENGNLLLTKRSRQKSLWPLFWDASTISHVLPGETVGEAANRRGKEELGMDVKFKGIGAFYYTERFNGNAENEYCHILVGISSDQAVLNPVEVDSIRNASFNDLKKEMKENPDIFTPWLKIAVGNKGLNEYFN